MSLMFGSLPSDNLFLVLAGVIALLTVITVILAILVFKLEKRIQSLTRGASGVSLEDTIRSLTEHEKRMLAFEGGVKKALEDLDRRVRRSIQSTATIRFNPFKGDATGGNQSFATALVSENGDGVVISSMYAREQTRVFAKPVQQGATTYELMDEEKEAITQGLNEVAS